MLTHVTKLTYITQHFSNTIFRSSHPASSTPPTCFWQMDPNTCNKLIKGTQISSSELSNSVFRHDSRRLAVSMWRINDRWMYQAVTLASLQFSLFVDPPYFWLHKEKIMSCDVIIHRVCISLLWTANFVYIIHKIGFYASQIDNLSLL